MRIWTEKRHQSEVNHELIWGSICTLVLVGALLLPYLPAHRSFCMFHRVTGKPCLSCGMTRTFESAIRGRLLDAFHWNPVGLALFFAVLLYVPYAWAVVLFRLPSLRIRFTTKWEIIALSVLLVGIALANWIYVWTNSLNY